MAFDSSKFYLGVNLGWLNIEYGHDLSFSFFEDWPPGIPEKTNFKKCIDAYFCHLNLRRISVVRIWLWERLEGLEFLNTNQFAYKDEKEFFERIDIIMEAASHYRIQVYWCLLDAAGLLKENTQGELCTRQREIFTKLVTQSNVRNSFKDSILRPFLNLLNKYIEMNVVFAIDMVNEIDWLWNKSSGVGLSRDAVEVFALDIFKCIKENCSRLDCTTSFASYSQMTKEGGTSFIDFFDFHRYYSSKCCLFDSNHWTLPRWTNSKPCIIGEAGHYYADEKADMDETKQSQSCGTLMKKALLRGYSGILLWRYSPVGGGRHCLLKFPGVDSFQNELDSFITVANTCQGSINAFNNYERAVWQEVKVSIQSIPSDRIP